MGEASEGRVVFIVDEQVGFLDYEGGPVIDPQFEEVFRFSQGLAAGSAVPRPGRSGTRRGEVGLSGLPPGVGSSSHVTSVHVYSLLS